MSLRLLAPSAGLAALLVAAPAAAEPTIGLEARGETVFTDPVRGGPGVEVTGGYALDTYPILLVPEVSVGGSLYPGSPMLGLFRAMAGVRVGITTVIEPAVYVHGGYGFVGSDAGLEHGAAIDAGVSLDKRINRDFTLGGALGYQGLVAGGASAHGLVLGFHVGFWL